MTVNSNGKSLGVISQYAAVDHAALLIIATAIDQSSRVRDHWAFPLKEHADCSYIPCYIYYCLHIEEGLQQAMLLVDG